MNTSCEGGVGGDAIRIEKAEEEEDGIEMIGLTKGGHEGGVGDGIGERERERIISWRRPRAKGNWWARRALQRTRARENYLFD